MLSLADFDARTRFRKVVVHPDYATFYSFSVLAGKRRCFGFELVEVPYFPFGEVGVLIGIPFRILFRWVPAIADGAVVVAQKVRAT
jgi:hypothetical protein